MAPGLEELGPPSLDEIRVLFDGEATASRQPFTVPCRWTSGRRVGSVPWSTSCCTGKLFNQEERFQKPLATCFSLVFCNAHRVKNFQFVYGAPTFVGFTPLAALSSFLPTHSTMYDETWKEGYALILNWLQLSGHGPPLPTPQFLLSFTVLSRCRQLNPTNYASIVCQYIRYQEGT